MAGIEINGKLLQMLMARLERISVDSYWAHRASGIRGALIRLADQTEAGQPVEKEDLLRNVQLGFLILEIAAREKRAVRKNWRN
jgi:hypothetical protein